MTQRFTVARIGGVAGLAVFDRVRRLSQRRRRRRHAPDKISYSGSDEYPAAVRARADKLVHALHLRAAAPESLYYSVHVDAWSMGDIPLSYYFDAHEAAPKSAALVETTSATVIAFRLPFAALQRRINADVRSRSGRVGARESRLLARRLCEALAACDTLVPTGVLLLIREVVAGTHTDDEILEACAGAPKRLTNPHKTRKRRPKVVRSRGSALIPL